MTRKGASMAAEWVALWGDVDRTGFEWSDADTGTTPELAVLWDDGDELLWDDGDNLLWDA